MFCDLEYLTFLNEFDIEKLEKIEGRIDQYKGQSKKD